MAAAKPPQKPQSVSCNESSSVVVEPQPQPQPQSIHDNNLSFLMFAQFYATEPSTAMAAPSLNNSRRSLFF